LGSEPNFFRVNIISYYRSTKFVLRILFIFEAVGVRALIEKEQNTQHKLSKINALTPLSFNKYFFSFFL